MAETYENGELGEAPEAVLAHEWRARLQGQQTERVDASRLAGAAPIQNENAIEAVAVSQQSGQILIRVRMRAPPARPPASFTLGDPPRIAFDFPNTVTGLGRSFDDLGDGDLRLIDVVQGGGPTRTVLTLRSMMRHDARVEGRDLVITLTPGGAPAVGAGRP